MKNERMTVGGERNESDLVDRDHGVNWLAPGILQHGNVMRKNKLFLDDIKTCQ